MGLFFLNVDSLPLLFKHIQRYGKNGSVTANVPESQIRRVLELDWLPLISTLPYDLWFANRLSRKNRASPGKLTIEFLTVFILGALVQEINDSPELYCATISRILISDVLVQ